MIKEIWQGKTMRTERKFNIPLPIKPHTIAADSLAGLSAILQSSPNHHRLQYSDCCVLGGLLVDGVTHSQESTFKLLDIVVASLVGRLLLTKQGALERTDVPRRRSRSLGGCQHPPTPMGVSLTATIFRLSVFVRIVHFHQIRYLFGISVMWLMLRNHFGEKSLRNILADHLG
jgi:hypothetical protein